MIERILDFGTARVKQAVRLLGPSFAAEANHKFDNKYFTDLMTRMIEAGSGVAWGMRGDDNGFVGLIAGAIAPSLYVPEPEAVGLFWYVLPKYRGRKETLLLFSHFFEWTKQCELRRVRFSHMTSIQSKKIGSFLLKKGFKKDEEIYLWQPQFQPSP